MPDPAVLLASAVGAGFAAALMLLLSAVWGFEDEAGGPFGGRIRVGRLGHAVVSVRTGAALAVGLVILILTRWPVAAAGVGALVWSWPYLFGGSRAETLAIARLEALVVWTESLRDTVAANASLEQAIAASTQRAPLLLQPALARLGGQLRVQTPLDAALLDLADDLDVPGADLVIAALILNVRRRGDRLAQVLSGLSVAAREELEVRRRNHAGRAGLRRAVQIIVVVTVAIAAYLTAFGGAFMRPYDSPAGQVALAAVGALFAAGFAWMRHLATDQDTAPFLSAAGRRVDPAHTSIVAALTGVASNAPGPRGRPGSAKGRT
jgi:tight adherence protein B